MGCRSHRRARCRTGHAPLQDHLRAGFRDAHRKRHARRDPQQPPGSGCVPRRRILTQGCRTPDRHPVIHHDASVGRARGRLDSPPLEVENLCVHYGQAMAVSGASFEIQPGRTLAILGSNGAGKSSIARAISGLVPASAGSVRSNGSTSQRIRRIGSAEPVSSTCPRDEEYSVGSRSSRTSRWRRSGCADDRTGGMQSSDPSSSSPVSPADDDRWRGASREGNSRCSRWHAPSSPRRPC